MLKSFTYFQAAPCRTRGHCLPNVIPYWYWPYMTGCRTCIELYYSMSIHLYLHIHIPLLQKACLASLKKYIRPQTRVYEMCVR